MAEALRNAGSNPRTWKGEKKSEDLKSKSLIYYFSGTAPFFFHFQFIEGGLKPSKVL